MSPDARALLRGAARWVMAVGANVSLFLLMYRFVGEAAGLSSLVTVLLYAWLGDFAGTAALALAVFPLHLLLYSWVVPMTAGSLLHDARYYLGTGIISITGLSLGYVQKMLRELGRLKASLERLAYSDPLTDLPNRNRLLGAITEAIARAARRPGYLFAVVALGVRRLDNVNTALGRQAGDELLRQVALRLRGLLRTGDCLARIGDDEFGILLDDLRVHEDAMRVLVDLTDAFRCPFDLRGRPYTASIATGVALSRREYTEAEEMLRDAALALRRSKDEGPERHTFFDPAMQERSRRLLEIEVELRRAFERGELHLVCQPIVDIAADRVDGFEALLRWRRSDGSYVEPEEFIPVAEATGLIVPIGEWIARTVCSYLAELERAGAGGLTMSMNVSPLQLGKPHIADYLSGMLAHHGVDPARLRIEITESAFVGERAAAIEAQALVAAGVRLAIDDFGTGYSSLSTLSRLPIDRIKLDRSFVRGVGRQSADENLIRAVLSMADALSRELVVEGIETPAQLQFLKSAGCRLVQGYLLGVPMPFEQLLERCRSRGWRAFGAQGVSPD